MIGHCLGAAGGLEAISTVKAINTGWLHPSINQFNSEPSVEFDTVANKKQQHEVNVGKTLNPFKLHDRPSKKCSFITTSLTVSAPKREKDPKKWVVITRMGLVSVFGNDVDTYYDKLLARESGIRRIDRFDAYEFPTRFAGQIRGFSSEGYIDAKKDKRLDDFLRYSLVAGKKALDDADLTLRGPNFSKKGFRKITPFFVPYTITNMASALLAIELGFMGPNYSISTTCATSNHCFYHCCQPHPSRALSQRNDDPQTASRLMEKDRDGFVMGEGAGVLVLESLEHVMKRGAPIIAEFLGGAINCDAYHVTDPRVDGLGVSSCIGRCLEDVGVSPEESLIRHCLGVVDGLEAIATLKAITTGWLHPSINQFTYQDEIKAMINHKRRRRLTINIFDLHSFNNLAHRILKNPNEYMQPFCGALMAAAKSVDPKYLKEGEMLHVGFEDPFVSHRVTPRELLSAFIGSMEYRDITSNNGLPTGSVYPTRDENGNLLMTEFGLCQYKDHQTLSIQEVPENPAPGQLPRTVDAIVEDDLVDSCKPGDRVAIVEIYKAFLGRSKGSVNGVFRTVFIANNVSLLDKEANAPIYNPEDLKNIKKIAERDNTFDLLGNSLAPSIYGHSLIKKAVVLLMLGGMEKNLKNGTHLRGDPSIAKSQLLRAIMNIAPLAISTTGRAHGFLLGAFEGIKYLCDQEKEDWEASAMVLGNRGVVCIDEFDKMNDQDRVAIHEVMEQQTLTIAKAGIHASLNARCSVVAATNSIYGTYDCSLTPTKNIGLPDSFLSRFDLLFIVLDQMDIDIDRQISEHVLRMHRFRSAIDGEHIATAYAELRNASSNAKTSGMLPITARTLETIIRLSTAHAKLKLSKKVTKKDVEAALKILNFAIYHKELTEMDEHEQERQKEEARKHRADR
ncbi:hypothetical protein REPUB_Repub13aG0032800 [Reevesia pubescens]